MLFQNISIKSRSVYVGVFILIAYTMLVSAATDLTIVVMLADVISGLAVIGIAILVYPLIVKQSKSVSISYLVFKFLEGALMIAAGIFYLFDTSIREWIYEIPQVITFALGGLALYYLLYQAKLVPRFISIWGLIAVFVLIVSNALNWFDISNDIINALLVLMITNEIFLAIYLFIKGFKSNTPVTEKNTRHKNDNNT